MDALASPKGNVHRNIDHWQMSCSWSRPRASYPIKSAACPGTDTYSHTYTPINTHTCGGTSKFNLVKCYGPLPIFLLDMNLFKTESCLSHWVKGWGHCQKSFHLPPLQILLKPWPANFVMHPPSNICIQHWGPFWEWMGFHPPLSLNWMHFPWGEENHV